MKLSSTAWILAAAFSWPAAAQVWDNSGNSMLNGNYYFREVIYTSSDAYALYGGINFSNGTYTVNAAGIEYAQYEQGGLAGPFTASGTYSISASGYGFISPLIATGAAYSVYGLVSAGGIFVGSSTESGYNDLFIAAPVSSQSTGSLNGNYSLAYMSLLGSYDALLQMNSTGSGTLGTVNVTAYSSTSTPIKQSISGGKYIVSSNAFVLTFPNSQTNVVSAQEYLYVSPDGNFVFGGAPGNTTSPDPFDMFVGVRTGSSSNLGGLYYQAGMDVNAVQDSLDTYYGSFAALSTGTILDHQRVQSGGVEDYVYQDTFPLGSNGSYTDSFDSTMYTIGSGGAVRIGLGIGPLLSISAAVQAPSLTPKPGVYLSPVGVVNAASSAPFTAGIARGEVLTLVGSNLGPSSLELFSTVPLPTNIGGVQVLINNLPAPLIYVSATQVAAIVPFETNTSIAQVQVVNNGQPSNVVTEFVNLTSPGIFTNPSGGIGYALAEHQDGSLVTPLSPALAGEAVSVYLTGLGDVFPGIKDGDVGPSNPPYSAPTNTITADIGGIASSVYFAGLAPGLAGLYQMNVLIPSGVTAGDTTLDIAGPDSYSMEALISIGSGTASPSSAAQPQVRRLPHHAKTAVRSTLMGKGRVTLE